MTTKCNKPIVVFDSSKYNIVWETTCHNENALDALISMFEQDIDAISYVEAVGSNMRRYRYVYGVRSI